MAKKATKKPSTPAGNAVGKSAGKSAGKPVGKPTGKPAGKPAPKPKGKAAGTPKKGVASAPAPVAKAQPKAATKDAAKAGPKPARTPAKQAANQALKPPVAEAEAKPTAKAAKQADTKASKPGKASKAPPARALAAKDEPETDGRPALKVHVHAGDTASDSPRGRSRKDSSGPTHNGIGDAAVRKATGKGWAEWLDIMDEAGCKAMDHKGIVAFLSETHATTDWWSQMVTVGYEQARGLRQKNEKADGFEAGVSKTINAATAKLYKAWEDEPTRERWMGDHKVEVRVANTDKNIRMTWLVQGPDEGSSVEVYFWPKDANKCLVQVQQRKLSDAEAVQRVRAFWSVKLENLRALMEKA